MITFLRLGDYGRLGNQLFQIAATLGLASRTARQAIFPDWEFAPWLAVPTAPRSTLEKSAWITVRPASFSYDPALHYRQGENINLEGYFQSEKYFFDAAGLVRAAIMSEPMERLGDQVARLHEIPSANDICAVHVRRGDYMKFSDTYRALSLATYYQPAMDMMRAKGIRRFIMVSDDPAWCRRVFRARDIEFSRNTGSLRDRALASQRHRDYARFIWSRWAEGLERYASTRILRDLVLMARCRHHIIANSSFSWWSSWLSDFAVKEVIAPRYWFADNVQHDTADLYRVGMTLL